MQKTGSLILLLEKDGFKGEVRDARKIYNSVELSKRMTATLDNIREVQERM